MHEYKKKKFRDNLANVDIVGDTRDALRILVGDTRDALRMEEEQATTYTKKALLKRDLIMWIFED